MFIVFQILVSLAMVFAPDGFAAYTAEAKAEALGKLYREVEAYHGTVCPTLYDWDGTSPRLADTSEVLYRSYRCFTRG